MIKTSWWVDFTFEGVRYRKRSPANFRSGALAYEATLRQKLARNEPLGSEPKGELLFKQFAWQWFDQYVVANNRASEQYAKRTILSAILIPFFGGIKVNAIRTNLIEQFKAQQVTRGVSNRTTNNRLAALSKCLRCAHEWLGIAMPTIRLLRCAPPKTNYLTAAECELLLSHAKGQLHEMVLLALRTGMRQGEIRGLQWSSIDWQSRSLVVRHSLCDCKRGLVSPKNNRERHIPLDTDLYELLFRRKRSSGYVFLNGRGDPYKRHGLIEHLGNICRDAHIRKIGWHVLRHTFATQLTLRGVPLTVVKELLGHSCINMTMRYSHVAPSALRSAIEFLNPKNATVAEFGQPVVNRWQQLANSNTLQIE
jgi:integrase